MITGLDVAMEAHEFIGTPFHHQGRAKGVGVDCAGLVVCVGTELGLLSADADVLHYGRQPNPAMFLDTLRRSLDPASKIEAGCVLSFAFARHQQHLGIALSDDTMMHAIDQHLVHVVTLGDVWRKRLRGVWHYRGVAYG